MRRLILGAWAVFLVASGCVHTKTLEVRDATLVAKLERRECYGRCPVYSASLWSNGVVTFQGAQCVKLKGNHEKRVSAETIQFVERALKMVKYCALESEYVRVDSTDGVTVLVSSAACGFLKTVRHYHGDNTAPLALGKLEDQLDLLLGTLQWVGPEKERDCGDRFEHDA